MPITVWSIVPYSAHLCDGGMGIGRGYSGKGLMRSSAHLCDCDVRIGYRGKNTQDEKLCVTNRGGKENLEGTFLSYWDLPKIEV